MAQGSGLKPNAERPSIINAMTVDVEDYFQVSAFESVVSRDRWGDYESRVAANTDRLLALFAEFGVHATFFVLGWVAEREPALVRRVAEAGHEIASHGYAHRLVYHQQPEEFREDIRRSKALIEAAAGQPVNGYRAPSFSITPRSLWALDVLAEEGFLYDASIFPIRHDRYGIPSAPRFPHLVDGVYGERRFGSGLLEIPAATVRIGGVNLAIAGGGYFRLLPYAWTRWGIAKVNHDERRPVVFYLHPWELDPNQPRLGAAWLARYRHYRNIDRTEHRLRRLLCDFCFGALAATVLPLSFRPDVVRESRTEETP
jgi:polysaccharide deacetylase family protein (PEP-CTERM system associated)